MNDYETESTSSSTGKASTLAAVVPVVVAMGGVILLAAVLQWQRSQKAANHPPQVDTMSARPDGLGRRSMSTPYDDLLMSRSTNEMLLLYPGDEALESEPAGLPPMPGAKRIAGFRRKTAGIVEEVSFWESNGVSASDIWSHYYKAAEDVQYTALRAAPRSNYFGRPLRSRLFVPAAAAESGNFDLMMSDRVLTIRVSTSVTARADGAEPMDDQSFTMPGENRIMVWLRYPDNHPTIPPGNL